MTRTEELLLLVLGACILVWLGLALYVLLTRVVYDASAAIVEASRGLVERGLSEALAGEEVDLGRLLRRLPRRTIERVAADTATPEAIAAVFAERALEGRESELLSRAQGSGRRPRWERVTALRILARARPGDALPLLDRALGSADEEVVAAAVTTLGELGNPRACELLVDALRRNVYARSRIATQLDTSSEPIPRLLVPLLHDFEAQVRFWGATLLGRYAGEADVDLELAAATGDADPSVRAAAVEGLGRGGRPAALAAALALLDDSVFFVRAHAARALRDLEGDGLAAVVAPLLADASWWVRTAAKETLEARPEAALEVLVSYLDHADRFARNGAAEVLQNTGALDRLVERVVDAPSDDDLRTLRRILAAGGERLVATAAARGGLDAERLETLAASGR